MRIPIHSQYVHIISVNDWDEKKKKLKQILDNTEYKRMNLNNGMAHFATDRGSKRDYADQFIQIFNDDLGQFGQELELNGFKIEDIWSVEYEKGDYHTVHTHGTVNWSGVLYVDYDENEHTGTHFVTEIVNPVTNSTMIHSPNAKEGMLIFFPATMLHFTLPNESDKIRRIVSLDITTSKVM